MTRTIICLGVKRSGTTALLRVFANHPEVRICHPEQRIHNWEPNFWNMAAGVLQAQRDATDRADRYAAWRALADRVAVMFPGARVEPPADEEDVFDLWGQITARYGRVVFDKSPQYLGSPPGLNLLRRYLDCGADVRVFAVVRNPLECIASQHRLWKDLAGAGTLEDRDRRWTETHRNLEDFRKAVGEDRCPVVRHEDLVADPRHWMRLIFAHCGVTDVPKTYAHIGTNSAVWRGPEEMAELATWTPSWEIKSVAANYGYDLKSYRGPPVDGDSLSPGAYALNGNGGPITSRRRSPRLVTRATMTIVRSLARHVPVSWFETLVGQAIEGRLETLAPATRLRTALALDRRLRSLVECAADVYGVGTHPKERLTHYHDFFVLRIHEGERVLDVRCGDGALAFAIARWSPAKVLAVDSDPSTIELARRRHAHPDLEFRCGNVMDLALGKRFDVVVLSNSLQMVRGRPRFLSELVQRIHAGRILIRVPSFERDWRVPLARELGMRWRLAEAHAVEYSQESLEEEAARAGLRICHLESRWGEIWAEAHPFGSS